MDQDADAELISEAIAVVQDARARAPRDFLFALALILGIVVLALLGGALLTGGTPHDLLLNLGTEVIGVWLTVVLINGLWRRREVGASAALDAMSRKLEDRRGSRLSEEERQAWRVFVDEYRTLVRAESFLDRVRALPAYRRRIRKLDATGNRTLEEFRQAANDAPWTQQ
jgi:membrane protein implicated in regulation of membrane protease activity